MTKQQSFSSRPIAAFSMADFERVTNPQAVAEFKRGKDKKKRKSRKGMITAGIGATALGTAAGLGTYRYARPEMQMRNAQKNFDAKGVLAAKGGAKGQLGRDVQAIRDMGSKVKNYNYGQAARNVSTNAQMLARDAFGGAKQRIGSMGTLGKVGLGLGAAGAVGGAGYGVYKMLQNKKKKSK